jgi:pimeloyl-ACP methyl ester carboxylesterase
MRPLLDRPPRSFLFSPTMTGVGDRAHLATPHTDLDLHIRDILAFIEMEGLTDIVLIGHSYGGMVATGVADRPPHRLRQLIYLDAFVPHDGESLYDITSQRAAPDPAWLVAPRPIPPDTSPADRQWIEARRTPQPVGSFTTKLRLTNEAGLPPRSYIRCARTAPDDPLLSSARRAIAVGWPYLEIDCSHSPHITAPNILARALWKLLLSPRAS